MGRRFSHTVHQRGCLAGCYHFGKSESGSQGQLQVPEGLELLQVGVGVGERGRCLIHGKNASIS